MNYNYRRLQNGEEKPKQKQSKLLENRMSEFIKNYFFNIWKACAGNRAEHERQPLVTKPDSCQAIKWAVVFPIHKLYNFSDSCGTTYCV